MASSNVINVKIHFSTMVASHKDKYIIHIENKLKVSEIQVHKHIENIEKIKIENKELKYLKRGNSTPIRKNYWRQL